ncbi:helix-turn-helix domain-containing protein [Cellulomonas persica]|uniref:helix-turn-helix domain-containing protein n=1 Tax=Cellulomonas persica TaxID=76861 RepID=UPI0011BF9A2C|nr:helix-turn-helix transcriptional regulator [Cellulomonas persica]
MGAGATTSLHSDRATRTAWRRRWRWRDAVGAVLRTTRLDAGLRLTDVSARAGVSTQYLSEIERGRKEASSEVLEAVTGALELSLADLALRVAELLEPEALAPVALRPTALPPSALTSSALAPAASAPAVAAPGALVPAPAARSARTPGAPVPAVGARGDLARSSHAGASGRVRVGAAERRVAGLATLPRRARTGVVLDLTAARDAAGATVSSSPTVIPVRGADADARAVTLLAA